MGNLVRHRLDYSVYFLFIAILSSDKILIKNLGQRVRFHTSRLICMQVVVTMWHNITSQLTAASTVPMQSAFDDSHRVSRITKYCQKNHKLRCLEVLKPILGHTFCLQHSLTRTLQDFGSIQQQLRLQEVKSVCKAQLYSAERRTLCRYYSHSFQSNLFVNLSAKEFQILKGKERGKGKGQPVAIGHYIGHCTELAGKTPEHHFFLCY